ncbi:CGNR zinc finger domain-containing protein [Arthrobacter castelli]|uniref:CGNR zinc finger domain-containing protein n=1 Tax=Arthrobacter castelli TaxID=271431 RepID=UPI0004214718|nr:CGNR zinc finger domain-containing protein [Arthrobacter castelli]
MTAFSSGAPEELRVIEDFCNTAILLHDIDELRTVPDARDWLNRAGWDPIASDRELSRLRDERETIRTFLVDRSDPSARHSLNELGQRHWAGARVDDDGWLALVPAAGSISPAGSAVEALLLNGLTASGRRLKACASDTCRYVFYDASRPRTRVWCDMKVCGARSKMRDYRIRLDS